MEDLKTQLDKLLKEYKEPINHKRSVIVIQGKKSILLKFHSNLKPGDWKQMGSTSKVKRYYSPEVETLAKELRGQQELHKMVCDTLKIRMYENLINTTMFGCKSFKLLPILIAC